STQSFGEYELSVFRRTFDRTVIRSIEAEADRGTPRVAAFPSANPGQQITIRGERFDGTDLVEFVGVDSSGNMFYASTTPVDILDGGRTLIVNVPSSAFTGSVRVNGTTVGPILQVVPFIDGLDQGANDTYFGGSLSITGGGF